jgi:PTS system nitrogen regulatory IIA component
VAGQWRFSPNEIHHWLEQRIGALDATELEQLEGALERSAPPAADAVSIAESLPIEAVAIPLPARTRSSVITSMVELAAQTGWLWDPERMADAVRQREDLHPTALDTGVALLHPRRPMSTILAQPFLAFGRTSQGIPFSGNRGQLTDLFFLILSSDDQGHLRTLARLSRMLADDTFLEQLRMIDSAAAAVGAIRDRELAVLDA